MEVSRLTTTSFEDLNTSNNDIRTWENTSETQELTQEQSNVILTDDAGIQGDTKWVGMDFHHNAHSTADNNNLKIAQRDGDVSPNGHRVRGSSSSTFLLDTGKQETTISANPVKKYGVKLVTWSRDFDFKPFIAQNNNKPCPKRDTSTHLTFK